MKMIQTNRPSAEWNAFLSPFFGVPSRGASSYSYESNGVSWFEDEDNYHARVEMPGVKKDALQVEAEDGLLRLSYEANTGDCSKEKCETARYGRTLRVPEKVDLSKVGAKLEDGILSLTLPKAEESKPVSIQIN